MIDILNAMRHGCLDWRETTGEEPSVIRAGREAFRAAEAHHAAFQWGPRDPTHQFEYNVGVRFRSAAVLPDTTLAATEFVIQ